MNGAKLYLYKTVTVGVMRFAELHALISLSQDAGPSFTVSLDGSKLQVYELTKTGGFAFSVESQGMPMRVSSISWSLAFPGLCLDDPDLRHQEDGGDA